MSIQHSQRATRIAAGVAGFALVLAAFAPTIPMVGAQTTTITTTATAASAANPFVRDLTIGSRGADVRALQTWLISRGFQIPSGPTDYFGTQTRAAVAAYQAANGIAPVAGYFGPLTRASVNVALGTNSGGGTNTPDANDDEDDEDDEDEDDNGLRGGAGTLRDADFVSSLNNEDVGEGDEEVEVLGLDLEADRNSDLRISSVRVEFELGSGDGSDDFDDYAEEVHILFDGEEVGSRDAEDFSERNGVWSSSISLDDDAVIRMGDEEQLVVAISALRNIDSSDLEDNTWEARVASVRYVDAQGAIITDSSTGDIGETREFEFTTFTAANDVELTVDESDDSPDERTVEVRERGDTEVTLLVGELEAQGSDIEITQLTAAITAGGTGDVSDIASEFILMIDGDEVATIDSDECTVAASCNGSATGTTAYFEFDDFEFTLDRGDTVEFEIVAVTNRIGTAAFAEGDSLRAEVDADLIEAEDRSDDLGTDALDGRAVGEEQFLRSSGLAVAYNDDKSGAESEDSFGEFTFVFDLTAFGDEEIDLTVEDFAYTVASPDGSTYTATAVLSAQRSVERNGSTYTLDDETGTFTFTVYVNPATRADSGVYRVTVTSIDGTPVNEAESTFVYAR